MGFGNPWFQAVEYRGRLILQNGYHRAWALLSLGIIDVPCLLLRANSLAELGVGNVGFFPEPVLMGDRPPTVADFNDDRVAVSAKAPALKKVIMLSAAECLIPIGETEPQQPSGLPLENVSNIAS